MKAYQCHKRVLAGKITEIGIHKHDDSYFVRTEDGQIHETPHEMFVRYRPVVGDYIVRYEPDGYEAFQPAVVFEAGYSLIEGNPS